MQLAIRARVLTLSVATTGAVALSATATGYARTAGSFFADGFWRGMELSASGFALAANNGLKVITDATPLTLTCTGCAADAEAAGRTLAVGLPSMRAGENMTFTPTDGVPFIEEQYLPGPSAQVTVGPNGDLEYLPQYAVHVNLPSDTSLTASRYVDALLRLLPPRAVIALPNGDVLRVRADVGPSVGQLQQSQAGFAVKPVTFFFRLRTSNSI